jgi:hypothetical protein
MRSIGMTQFRLKKQLQEWLELSTQKGIPIFLLIASRAFMLNTAAVEPTQAGGTQASSDPADPDQVLKSSMSFLDADTINEVVLEAASTSEADTPDMRRRRLESIQFQKEVSRGHSSARCVHGSVLTSYAIALCSLFTRSGRSRTRREKARPRSAATPAAPSQKPRSARATERWAAPGCPRTRTR